MSRVLLVRHGATDWNETGRLQGWTDTELTPRGREQATTVATRLTATHEISRIVSSPLSRATETAEILAAHTDVHPVVTDSGWRERSFGAYEGERADAVFDIHPELHPKSAAFDPDASLDGESCRAVVSRVRDSWRDLRRRIGEKETVAVVTHESPLRIVAGFVGEASPIETLQTHSFTPGTTAAVDGCPDDDGGWTVVKAGDYSSSVSGA